MPNKIQITRQLSIIFVLLTGSGFSVNAADNSNISQLRQKQSQLQRAQDALDKVKIQHENHQVEINSAKSTLHHYRSARDAQKHKLTKLRDLEESNPDIDFTPQINAQSQKWKKANKQYITQLNYVKGLENKAYGFNAEYRKQVNSVESLEITVNRLKSSVADTELNKRLRGIQRAKRVKVQGTATCSVDNVTRTSCLEEAKTKAHRKASEKGSTIVVSSFTQMKNFNITRDEAKTRVNARISDIKELRKDIKIKGDAWYAVYQISAVVTPVISEDMRNDLKEQILASISAGDTFSSSSAKPRSSNVPVYSDKEIERREEKERAREEQLRLQAQLQAAEEAERIRMAAEQQAEQEAERQVVEEKKNANKRRVFGGF